MKALDSFLIRAASSVMLAAIISAGYGQSYRVAWTRTNANADTQMDTARDAIVNSQGQFVVAGASIQPNGDRWATVTIFSRDWTKLDDVALNFGGKSEFDKIIQVGSDYIAVGRHTSSPGANEELVFVKLNAGLQEITDRFVVATPAGGSEKPTDMVADGDGNVYVSGIAQFGAQWENFLVRVNEALTLVTNFNIAKTTSTYGEPSLAPNGIIAILIGLLTDQGPRLISYSPTGTENFTFGITYPATHSLFKCALQRDLINGHAYFTSASTNESTPGTFVSAGTVSRVNATTGVATHQYAIPGMFGVGLVSPRDMASGLPTGKRVNLLLDRGSRPTLYSLNENLNTLTSWQSSVPLVQSSGLILDASGASYLAMVNSATSGNSQMVKLSSTNGYLFGWAASQTGFLLPYMEQDNVYDPKSGDILTIKTDNDRMQLTCVKQAPVAVADAYSVRSGVNFSPPASVFSNDRYYGDATIAIVTQPAHGTVTINAFGYFTYKSNQGYVGPDSFSYRLTKPSLSPSTATISITVQP